jgi:hypothetical protein
MRFLCACLHDNVVKVWNNPFAVDTVSFRQKPNERKSILQTGKIRGLAGKSLTQFNDRISDLSVPLKTDPPSSGLTCYEIIKRRFEQLYLLWLEPI